MPVYTPTTWVNGSAPAINATNLNKIEAGIAAALRLDGSTVMTAQLITAAGSAATPAIAPTGDPNNGIFFPVADTIAFTTNGTERLRVTSAGSLGIGIAAPAAVLHLAGSIGTNTPMLKIANTGTATGTQAGLAFYTDNVTTTPFLIGKYPAIDSSGAVFISNQANSAMTFDTNAITRMTIDAAGKVGIGIAPTVPLHLYVASADAIALAETNNTGGAASLRVKANGTGGGHYWWQTGDNSSTLNGKLRLWDAVASAERITITAGGSVGIGTPSPSYLLQLTTDSAAKPTSAWTVASDARIKTVTGEYTKGLESICSLRPITYKYNGKAGFIVDGKEMVSIIAQEAIKDFPECVGTFSTKLEENDTEETELYNWNSHAITFALINAVKELNQKVIDLEAKLANK